MFCLLVMAAASQDVLMVMPAGGASTVHGTGYDRSCDPAQRRDPGREKSDDQTDGEKSTHHAANVLFANRFRFSGLTVRCLSGIPSRRESTIRRSTPPLQIAAAEQLPLLLPIVAEPFESCKRRSSG